MNLPRTNQVFLYPAWYHPTVPPCLPWTSLDLLPSTSIVVLSTTYTLISNCLLGMERLIRHTVLVVQPLYWLYLRNTTAKTPSSRKRVKSTNVRQRGQMSLVSAATPALILSGHCLFKVILGHYRNLRDVRGNGSDIDYIMGLGLGVGIKSWEWE